VRVEGVCMKGCVRMRVKRGERKAGNETQLPDSLAAE